MRLTYADLSNAATGAGGAQLAATRCWALRVQHKKKQNTKIEAHAFRSPPSSNETKTLPHVQSHRISRNLTLHTKFALHKNAHREIFHL
jgi:hypothetical protein